MTPERSTPIDITYLKDVPFDDPDKLAEIDRTFSELKSFKGDWPAFCLRTDDYSSEKLSMWHSILRMVGTPCFVQENGQSVIGFIHSQEAYLLLKAIQETSEKFTLGIGIASRPDRDDETPFYTLNHTQISPSCIPVLVAARATMVLAQSHQAFGIFQLWHDEDHLDDEQQPIRVKNNDLAQVDEQVFNERIMRLSFDDNDPKFADLETMSRIENEKIVMTQAAFTVDINGWGTTFGKLEIENQQLYARACLTFFLLLEDNLRACGFNLLHGKTGEAVTIHIPYDDHFVQDYNNQITGDAVKLYNNITTSRNDYRIGDSVQSLPYVHVLSQVINYTLGQFNVFVKGRPELATIPFAVKTTGVDFGPDPVPVTVGTINSGDKEYVVFSHNPVDRRITRVLEFLHKLNSNHHVFEDEQLYPGAIIEVHPYYELPYDGEDDAPQADSFESTFCPLFLPVPSVDELTTGNFSRQLVLAQ